MVPSAFVTLAAWPLTPNGKLDRKALPAPDMLALAARTYEAPQGEVEAAIAAIWQDLLGVAQVGRQDHFFELGGHSLMVIGMIERLRQHGLSADVRAVFSAPTLAALAAQLGASSAQNDAVPANLIRIDSAAITPDMLPLAALTQAEIDAVVACSPKRRGEYSGHLPTGPAAGRYPVPSPDSWCGRRLPQAFCPQLRYPCADEPLPRCAADGDRPPRYSAHGRAVGRPVRACAGGVPQRAAAGAGNGRFGRRVRTTAGCDRPAPDPPRRASGADAGSARGPRCGQRRMPSGAAQSPSGQRSRHARSDDRRDPHRAGRADGRTA
ncbi:phosphopantetheine-binding protein [Massilia sp. H-1]|nr:phosphopantetheine-binding protein [Massilia sp. H-1]